MKQFATPALLLAALMTLTAACTSQTEKKEEDTATRIQLSDEGITVDGKAASTDPAGAVYVGADIIYYEDRDTWEDGSAYGEGTAEERHSIGEAAEHTVVTITQPGTYRLSGSLSKGQIAIDLGEEAKDDPQAVVTLILDNVDVKCTVAPALIFYNVYECDRDFVAYDNDENPDYEATAYVDTSEAGANVILAAGSENTFQGSHVARIYKEGTTKKLHKYDGAFYSKMSMNISEEPGGAGILNIVADNEGLDSELHLSINGGAIRIEAQNDGINTNEDYVSVTTVNGGTLEINAGLGAEGDGIDSNGYLVINGGTVWSMANPQTGDGGIDAEEPILINGGMVYAFGSRNDTVDNGSGQAYMELSFAATLPAGSLVELKDPAGEILWSAQLQKACQAITLTVPELKLDTAYQLYVDDVLQGWSGNGYGMGFPGGMGGQRPEGQEPLEGMERPEGMEPPEGFDPGQPPQGLEGFRPDGGADLPEEMTPDEQARPLGRKPPEGAAPEDRGGRPGGVPDFGEEAGGEISTQFTLTETVKSFSGIRDAASQGS
ncbi:MAG: carbohydrate-binding domain-containing protein [Oscillospiraceae bacterium]|nr:carbohydrate-binding domain-containing protein [Oscillospiraceae bacterium]